MKTLRFEATVNIGQLLVTSVVSQNLLMSHLFDLRAEIEQVGTQLTLDRDEVDVSAPMEFAY